MSKPGFTPGPWELARHGSCFVTAESKGIVICNIFKGDNGNANLIASSPDLFAVLQDFAEWDERYPKGTVHSMAGERELDELFERARAALAKAKGEA